MEENKCEKCDKKFETINALTMHNKAKHPEMMPKEKKSLPVKKIRNWSILVIIVGLVITGVIFGILNNKTLPPTDMRGHVEESPKSHVLKEPMPIAIQKHMLEHADGTGPPGIVINYNCISYQCEENLIENLEAFAKKNPAHVYVAPFKGMDAKIALTRLGKIKVLEEYNQEAIANFIERR